METFKWIFVCLAASFLAVSCTDETEINDYDNNGIRFMTESDIVQTRGLPVFSSNDIPDMGVFAYYTGNGTANNWIAQGASATPNLMNNVQINHTDGVWSYDDPVHWPQAADANVSFFAYSPYATAANGITMNASTGIPSITYTVPSNCSDQPDLMVSALLKDRNRVNNGSSPVNFQLRHALTCIGFKASGNGEQITKITAKGVKTSGVLTVAEDGTPSWNTSASGSGNFEATVDDGVYLGALAQLVNTGGGYLMMIPQTLGTGAMITVELNSGRSFDFDLSGITWTAGKFINYNLSITPEAALLLTPEKIVLPQKGGFSQFNVIVENGSDLDWTVAIDNPGFVICDNLTDLLSWANGTPVANIRNLNNTTPGTQFTGTGSKTLYVWKPTANTSTTAEVTGTITNVSDPTGVSINVIQLPNYAMAAVRNSYMSGEYVGAFWKADQKGERIIRIPVTNAVRAGEWDASVYWLGYSWKAGDIVFSTEDSDDAGINFSNAAIEHPADMNNPANDALYSVPGYASSASGTAVSGAGNYIHFRIGLTSTFSATDAMPARYALVLLRYGTPQKFHAIFIRQGHGADFVMSPGDNMARDAAARFSPYNTTASNLADNVELVDVGPDYNNTVFTDYPSQAGAFFQWANDGNPVAYNPRYPLKPVVWAEALTGQYWSTVSSTQESCPSGYHRPSDGITGYAAANSTTTGIESSEIRQSLYVTPTLGNAVSSANFRWGFYADGYFDRRDHNNPSVTSPHEGWSAMKAGTAVSWNSKDVAYIGTLVFNPTTGSSRENASIFIPAAGSRHADTGALIEAGEGASFLSSSAPNTTEMWYFVGIEGVSYQLNSSRTHGLSLRCVRNQ